MRLTTSGCTFCLVAFSALGQVQATKYPHMAPIEQYLIADRNAEVTLARSAAPAAISGDATVLVLTRRGYETAATGKNGFVCLVDRAWQAMVALPLVCTPLSARRSSLRLTSARCRT
jgi:hypothetical protein